MDKIKGFLFDLDGVLVSTEKNHFYAWQKTAQKLGIEFNEIDNEALKGVSRVDSLQKILNLGKVVINENEFTDLLEFKNSNYLDSIKGLNTSSLLPGVLDLLKKAKQKGVKIGLGSSSKNAKPILELLNILNYFDVIMDGTNVEKPKPNSEVFLKGASSLNLVANQCIVFEDALSGVLAAKSGGFFVVGVGNPTISNSVDLFLNDLTEFRIEDYA